MQLDETGCKTLGSLTTALKSAFIGLCLGVKAQLRMDLRIMSYALNWDDGTADMFWGKGNSSQGYVRGQYSLTISKMVASAFKNVSHRRDCVDEERGGGDPYRRNGTECGEGSRVVRTQFITPSM
jgi:hypothetical protein